MVEKSIAIILARGGSKRIPRKNIVDFFGLPMVAWTIQAAVFCNKFDRVIVSTDDPEIADISKGHGADVPFLRQVAADDMSKSSEATLAALVQAEDYYGEKYELVAQLMANCPLRESEDISQIITEFKNNRTGSILSCFKYGWMNPWWAFQLDKNMNPIYLRQEMMENRSQDLPKLYCPSGATWIANVNDLKRNKTFYMPGHRFYPTTWESSVDIDDEDDLFFAKSVYQMRRQVRVVFKNDKS